MKKLALDQLKSGMKLARTVYTPDGRVMVAAGTELNQSILVKLKERGLPSAYIELDSDKLQGETAVVSEKTVAVLHQAMYGLEQNLRLKKELSWEKCKEPLGALIDEAVSNRGRLFCSTDIRVNEAYLYGHSVNVALLSILIGATLGYNALKLRELAIGALFHDIGMLLLPVEITHKRGPLNPAELRSVQDHPTQGFQILRGRTDITAVTANVAYQHHERLDGSGYPRQLAKDKILEMAQIVGVADVYDAMTSDRVYRQAFTPGQTINYLRANSGQRFEPLVVAALIKNVAEYTVGTLVRLNTGQMAEVIRVNDADGRRPVVSMTSGEEIDLLQTRNLIIMEEQGPAVLEEM